MKRLVLLFIGVLFIACQDKQTSQTSMLQLLPSNARVVIKTEGLQSLASYKDTHAASAALHDLFPAFFELLDSYPQKTSGQLSFHLEGKEKLSHLLISPEKPIKVDSLVLDTLYYDKTPMLRLSTDPPSYYASWDSLHFSASSKLLLENSIRLKKAPNVTNPTLEQLYTSATEAHTVFVHQDIAPFFQDLLQNFIAIPWKKWSEWTAVVPSVNDSGIYARAYGLMATNGGMRMSPIANQTSSLQELAQYIPSSAQQVQAFSLEHNTYKQAASRYRIVHNEPEVTLDSLLIDAKQVAQAKVGEGFLGVISSSLDSEELAALLARHAKAQYNDNEIVLYEFKVQKENLFSPILENKTFTHAGLSNQHIVLGTSKTDLALAFNALNKEDVLTTSTSFQDYVSTLPKRSSFWTWTSPAYFENKLKKTVPLLKDHAFGPFRQADIVGVVEGDVFYFTLSLQNPTKGSNKVQAVELSASISFENPIIWGPYAVRNHKTQALEWVVQDEENQLYLLQNTGEILWQKQLDGPILGDVQQVDLYRNKRLQLAFTTDKSFWVLDRNGNEVSGFRRKDMRASSTFAVFDYDKQRDYRILLSTAKSLRMYDRRMRKVSGWRKTKLNEALAYPAKHIRIGNRDYIALVYNSGKANLLHRSGKVRIKLPADLRLSQGIYPYQNGFVSIDDKNRLIQISTNGKVSKNALPFETRYALAANKNTLVTLTENKVSINNQLVELDFGVYAPPKIQVVNNKTYILVWDNQSGKTYLFNRDAELLDSFPVSGEWWAMLGQGSAGATVYLATRSNKQEIRFYRMP